MTPVTIGATALFTFVLGLIGGFFLAKNIYKNKNTTAPPLKATFMNRRSVVYEFINYVNAHSPKVTADELRTFVEDFLSPIKAGRK